MKKILLLFVFSIMTMSVFAEVRPEDLDKLLSISTSTEFTTTNVVYPGISLGGPFFRVNTGFATHSTSADTVWYPYLGGYRISHQDFFTITGQESFAQQYQNYERALSSWRKGRIAGFVFLGASSLLTIIAAIGKTATRSWRNNDPWSIALYVGVGTFAASAIVVPIVEVCRPRRPDISINFAISLAEAHNQKYVI